MMDSRLDAIFLAVRATSFTSFRPSRQAHLPLIVEAEEDLEEPTHTHHPYYSQTLLHECTMNHRQQQQQQQIIRLPEPQELGGLVVRNVTSFARRNKVVTGFYLLGWIFLVFVGSGTRLTMQQQANYNRIMSTINVQAEYDATDDYWKARQMYQATKGWFTCDGMCQRHKARMERAEMNLKAIRQEGAARMADAKQSVGLLSEIGVGEVKDSFFTYLYQGKQFAKRQSMWDALFIGIRTMTRGRDESMLEYGLKGGFD